MIYSNHRGSRMEREPRRRFHGPQHGTWTWSQLGPHIGKGSRGYRRADERVYEEVCERMMQHGDLDASEIEVKNGEVILAGTVPDRRAKRLAKDIADSVHGVQDVHNQLQLQNKQRAPEYWTDRVGHSGVYPASEAEKAPSDAEVQGMAPWGQGERGARGYDDHGESELHIDRQNEEEIQR